MISACKKTANLCPITAAANVARAISEGKYERGVIICGTGAGSAIVANKFKGVYAVHCTNGFEAKRARR